MTNESSLFNLGSTETRLAALAGIDMLLHQAFGSGVDLSQWSTGTRDRAIAVQNLRNEIAIGTVGAALACSICGAWHGETAEMLCGWVNPHGATCDLAVGHKTSHHVVSPLSDVDWRAVGEKTLAGKYHRA